MRLKQSQNTGRLFCFAIGICSYNFYASFNGAPSRKKIPVIRFIYAEIFENARCWNHYAASGSSQTMIGYNLMKSYFSYAKFFNLNTMDLLYSFPISFFSYKFIQEYGACYY